MTELSFIFDNSFLLGIFVVIICFVCHKHFGFYLMKIEKNKKFKNIDDNASTHCSDQNCVRCCKYRQVLDAAAVKILTLKDDYVTSQIKECLQNGLTQIHQSKSEQNPNVFYDSFLCGKYFWNKDILPEKLKSEICIVENSHELIVKEFKSVYNSNFVHLWKRNSTEQGSWDVFHLVNQGTFMEEHCSICPNTTKLIKELTSFMEGNVFGNILFSVVKPSTLIASHYGPTNIRLRCHLGLATTDKCVLNVGKEQRTWSTGECLVFDDSFLHSVKHNGIDMGTNKLEDEYQLIDGCLLEPGDRAVLIIDIWHPQLSHKERNILNFLFSPELT